MKLTKEQIKTLSAWEDNFRTAVKAQWARNPGRSGLRVIWETFTQATGDRRRFNDNCSTCILSLLQDCGRLYFQDKEELARLEAAAKKVETDTETKEFVVKHVSVNTTKKPTRKARK